MQPSEDRHGEGRGQPVIQQRCRVSWSSESFPLITVSYGSFEYLHHTGFEVVDTPGPKKAHPDGRHPVVYIGKIAHGSYHNSNTKGLPKGLGLQCVYYGDWRYPKRDKDNWHTYFKLIDLDERKPRESWIKEARKTSWQWGPDGVWNNPTERPPESENVNGNECPQEAGVAVAGCKYHQSVSLPQ